MRVVLKFHDAGALTTIQDRGRFGYQAYGVPVSGAMDVFSFTAANALVGNHLNDAAIEIHSPVTLETDAPALVALTGAEARIAVNGRTMPQWTAIFARAGSLIEIRPAHASGWQYLAIHGGLDAPRLLGSRSTYLRGHLGGWLGRALESGDEITVGTPSAPDYAMVAGRAIDARACAFFDSQGGSGHEKIIRVVLGPHTDWFAPAALASFTQGAYYVTASADRMGYRLRGPALARLGVGELISCGVPLGALQIPGDGQPIVLMADHQTTGGYPIIATVIGADVPVLAQCMEGQAIRFLSVDSEQAARAWEARWHILENSI